MGHEEDGRYVTLLERAQERGDTPGVPFVGNYKIKEDMLKFIESFEPEESPSAKCTLGCAVEVDLRDLEGLEHLNIILVKKVPVDVKPASPDHRLISAESLVGKNLLGLEPGGTRTFLNNANQETVISLKRIETTPSETRQKFFPGL